MGRQIHTHRFTSADFADFEAAVQRQAKLVIARIRTDPKWATDPYTLGEETELVAYTVADGRPYMKAYQIAEATGAPWEVELGRWNLERNGEVQSQIGTPYSRMATSLTRDVRRMNNRLATHGAKLAACGLFPALNNSHTLNRSLVPNPRYFALGDQLQRQYGPINLKLHNSKPVNYQSTGIGLEAFTTGRQPHISVSTANAANMYNASLWAAAVVIGLQGFSPLVFGHHVSNGDVRGQVFAASIRGRGQGFGKGWVKNLASLVTSALGEPVLLPVMSGRPDEELQELTLHLGSLWPLIRLILAPESIRLEYRYTPSMPIPDMVAGDAAIHGLARLIAENHIHDWLRLPDSFAVAKTNFEATQEFGPSARIFWPNSSGGYTQTTPARVMSSLAEPTVDALTRIGVQDAEWAISPVVTRANHGLNGSSVLMQMANRLKGRNRMQQLSHILGDNIEQPVHLWQS